VPFAAGAPSTSWSGSSAPSWRDHRRQGRVVKTRRPGGVIGTEMTAQAPGDGYTLLLHSASITYDPALHDKLTLRHHEDLAPVAMIGTTPTCWSRASFPARSAQDLIR